MATSFMSAPPSNPSFPAEVFNNKSSLDAATAIAQATSIANATHFNWQQQQDSSQDLFEPVPLNQAQQQPQQQDTALARMLSQALDEITSGFDSDPLADYNSLYNLDPFAITAPQQPQQQQDLFFPATTASTTASTSTGSSNKRSMPSMPLNNDTTCSAPPTKRARKTKQVDEDDDNDEDTKSPRFRPYQEKQWVEQFDELLKFKEQHGHCLVPHTFDENPTLSRWVKRQRYQYKLKQESKQSTMTDARIVQLEQVGFVWDSHAAAWQERLHELALYKQQYGDCNVPSNFPKNPQLATWVKCQRRQCKLFWCGKTSNMTLDRFAALNNLGFTWELRNGSITKKMMEQQQQSINNNNGLM